MLNVTFYFISLYPLLHLTRSVPPTFPRSTTYTLDTVNLVVTDNNQVPSTSPSYYVQPVTGAKTYPITQPALAFKLDSSPIFTIILVPPVWKLPRYYYSDRPLDPSR